jgi:hypothetical protein
LYLLTAASKFFWKVSFDLFENGKTAPLLHGFSTLHPLMTDCGLEITFFLGTQTGVAFGFFGALHVVPAQSGFAPFFPPPASSDRPAARAADAA